MLSLRRALFKRDLARLHVVTQESFDHRGDLIGRFHHVEVPRSYRPAIDDIGQPLRHEVGRIERRLGGQVKRGHLAPRRRSRTIEAVDLPRFRRHLG